MRQQMPNRAMQPTATPALRLNADLSECAATCRHLRLPEPWL